MPVTVADNRIAVSQPPQEQQPFSGTLLVGAILAVLLGSELWKIIAAELGFNGGIRTAAIITGFLLCAAAVSHQIRSLKPIAGFVLTIAAAQFSYQIVVPAVEGAIFTIPAARLEWPARFFLLRCAQIIPSFILLTTFVGSGITRRDLFLCRSNLDEPVQWPAAINPKRTVSWRVFAVIASVAFAASLSIYLSVTLNLRFGGFQLALAALPWAILTSTVNAANEEFQFRSVILARLRPIVRPDHAAILAGAFFGLNHYFGAPSGWLGVVMAGIAGWIWAKSMLETRGFTCAFTIHFVQDFVIFLFLATSTTGLGHR